MQRKPGYPVANCSIKMPDNTPVPEMLEDEEAPQRRQQLINFGHAQWGFNNWSWVVSKQDLDFVDLSCGKYSAGVAAFVSITVKTLDIHRENVGYATAHAPNKGSAIHRARKCAVTNALRETLLSFGGAVASELLELDAHRAELPSPLPQNNPALANKQHHLLGPSEPKNASLNKIVRKEPESAAPATPATRTPVAKALPMLANLPPAANRPPPPAPAAAPAPAPVPAPAPAPPRPAPLAPLAPLAQPPAPQHALAPHARPNSNEALGSVQGAQGSVQGAQGSVKGEQGSVQRAGADSDEARAERRRRQRAAQEQFRRKQLQPRHEENQDLENISTSVDNLLMAIPTQDIIKNEAGNTAEEPGKRKSPTLDGGAAKRRGTVLSRLDIAN